MKKMQENMKKKYSCDRSTTATRLEDLLQDAVVSVEHTENTRDGCDDVYYQSFALYGRTRKMLMMLVFIM